VIDLSVGDVSIKEAGELFLDVTSIHVEGKSTAIFATDRTGRTMLLYRVVIQDGGIVSRECLDSRNKREMP
jgi:hypothetical protein